MIGLDVEQGWSRQGAPTPSSPTSIAGGGLRLLEPRDPSEPLQALVGMEHGSPAAASPAPVVFMVRWWWSLFGRVREGLIVLD